MKPMSTVQVDTAKPHLGIEPEILEYSIASLKHALADHEVLYQMARKFHWNLKGQRFRTLHEWFEEQYTALEQVIDDIAERILSLGENAPGTFTEFIELTHLKEEPGVNPDSMGMLTKLLETYESIIRELREAIVSGKLDTGTEDFFTGLMRDHEKTAWMMRSYLTE